MDVILHNLALSAMPLSCLAGGIILGFIADKIVIRKLEAFAKTTEWKGDEIIISSLKGAIFLWFMLLGVYMAALNTELSAKTFHFVHQGIVVLWLISATMVLSRIAVGFIRCYSSTENGNLKSTTIFINIARLVVFGVGTLIILQSLGISVTPLLTALGVGGLAVALALQDTLGNLFAGLNIVLAKQMRPGHYIKVNEDAEGMILDINWRNTIITTPANNSIIIPNSKMAGAIITNFHTPSQDTSLSVPVTVAFGTDPEKLERITLETAAAVAGDTPGALAQTKPLVRFSAIAENGIQFSVTVRCKDFSSQFLIKHELIKRLLVRYEAEGIKMPQPLRVTRQ